MNNKGVESEGDSIRITEDNATLSYRIEIVVDRLPTNDVLRARRAEEATHEAHHREQRGRIGEQRRTMLTAIDDAILKQCCTDSNAVCCVARILLTTQLHFDWLLLT